MSVKPKLRKVEPFFLYGSDSKITSKENAKKVVKANMYYMIAFTIALFALHLANIYYAEGTLENYNYLVLTLLFGSMSFLAYQFMSRTASIIIFIIAILAMIIMGYIGILGIRFLFATIVATAAYRCIKATFYYQKQAVANV